MAKRINASPYEANLDDKYFCLRKRLFELEERLFRVEESPETPSKQEKASCAS